MDFKNPKLVIETAKTSPGEVSWQSPSNLAIIKYWGKYGLQLPRNPSISFTLNKACTETKLEYKPKESTDTGIALKMWFNGQQANEVFQAKTIRFFEGISEYFPFLRQLDMAIHTTNTFPHSTGIASSASGMSALALCICDLEQKLFGTLSDEEAFFQKASFIARLGSGSACRSVYPTMALWGETSMVSGSSNLYAVPYAELAHSVFHSYHDDILIISRSEKSVSSRAGHDLMEGNVYADSRYQQAKLRLSRLLDAIKSGDVETFGQIAEKEALSLHALMMSSEPPYLLLKPNTIQVIEMVQRFREANKVPLYFSLDAGPNLHLLYPDAAKKEIQQFIRAELSVYCEQNLWIEDGVGGGPQRLRS